MMKKRIVTLEHVWEVDAIKSLLADQNIAYYEIKKPREYMEIYTGTAGSRVEIYVDEEQLAEAQKVLAGYRQSTGLHSVEEEDVVASVKSQKVKLTRGRIVATIFLVYFVLQIIWVIKNYMGHSGV